MSVSLFIYSPQQPLTREQIISACRNEHASADRQWEIAFLHYNGTPDPHTGALRHLQRILAWRRDTPQGERMRALLESDDRAAINELYANNKIATMTLDVVTRDQKEWPVDDALIEHAPPELRDDIGNAHTWYGLETSARRNRLSLKCQEDLWATIGALSDGVMEDPQNGQYNTRDGRTW